MKIINMDIENYNVPDNTKVATVRPIYKKKSRNESKNYRPVSLLNAFSKIYESYIHNSITRFFTIFFLYLFEPTEKATAQTMC